MKTEEELRRILSHFAQAGEVHAVLLREEDPGRDPTPTGASLLFGERAHRQYMVIRGIKGELPANIRIDQAGAVSASSEESPGKWEPLEDDEDARALRIFSLLDPRLISQQMYNVDIKSASSVLVYIDLAQWKPELPKKFLEWLGPDSSKRAVNFEFKDNRPVKMVQADLPPWHTDQIIVQYSYPPRDPSL